MSKERKKKKKTLENGKTAHAHGLRELMLWKIAIFTLQTQHNPNQSSMTSFTEMGKNPKINMEPPKTPASQSNPE